MAARDNPKAVVAFYNFINPYQLYEKGRRDVWKRMLSVSGESEMLMKRARKK